MAGKSIQDVIKEKDVKYIDLRFTDPRGKLQHVTVLSDQVDEDFLDEGFMFDGSSIAGWKGIEASDMKLMPDTESVYVDPFYAEKTICLHCSIVEPDTGESYERDPRGTAEKAEAYLKSSGIGDVAYFGPEAEFFLFDDVTLFDRAPTRRASKSTSVELPTNSDTAYETGNLGHRPRTKGGYFPANPIDSCQDLRGEMLTVMEEMGVKIEKHHHEVAAAQHELGTKFQTLTTAADHMQIYKYVIHNVAQGIRQDGDLHAEAGVRRQRLGHALPSVDLEGRQAALRRQQVCRPEPGMPLVHRRHPQACQDARTRSPTRRPTATSA